MPYIVAVMLRSQAVCFVRSDARESFARRYLMGIHAKSYTSAEVAVGDDRWDVWRDGDRPIAWAKVGVDEPTIAAHLVMGSSEFGVAPGEDQIFTGTMKAVRGEDTVAARTMAAVLAAME